MKEKLIDFLEKHALFKYELDAGSESRVRNAIDDFFEHEGLEKDPVMKYLATMCDTILEIR